MVCSLSPSLEYSFRSPREGHKGSEWPPTHSFFSRAGLIAFTFASTQSIIRICSRHPSYLVKLFSFLRGPPHQIDSRTLGILSNKCSSTELHSQQTPTHTINFFMNSVNCFSKLSRLAMQFRSSCWEYRPDLENFLDIDMKAED